MKKFLLIVLAMFIQGMAGATLVPSAFELAIRQTCDGSVRTSRLTSADALETVTVRGATKLAFGSVNACDGSVLVNPFSVIFDSDPFISFAIGVFNATSTAQTYSFTFSLPYLGGSYNLLTSGLTGNVSDSHSQVDLTDITMDSEVDGLNLLAISLPNCSGAVASLDCGTQNGSTSVTSNANGFFGTALAFTLGAGDAASFSGHVELTSSAIPEPQTYALILLGLALICAMGRRRTRRV